MEDSAGFGAGAQFHSVSSTCFSFVFFFCLKKDKKSTIGLGFGMVDRREELCIIACLLFIISLRSITQAE